MATLRLLESPYLHIKENSVLKAYWADVPYVCWGEHCLYESTFLRCFENGYSDCNNNYELPFSFVRISGSYNSGENPAILSRVAVS